MTSDKPGRGVSNDLDILEGPSTEGAALRDKLLLLQIGSQSRLRGWCGLMALIRSLAGSLYIVFHPGFPMC
jgi:hypothetical protein